MNKKHQHGTKAGDDSIVRKQLAGKRLLITGTTGFLGKVLLEKILRDLPEIEAVYLLIRGSTKYPSARDRFINEIACSSIFETLKVDDPAAFDALCDQKVRFVTGEVTEPCFGMEENAFRALAKNVDVVVNSAASVNFREELDKALTINALCLHNLADFSEAAGDIPVLQVSTCYVNGFNAGPIYEQNIHPAGADIPQHAAGFYDVASVIATLDQKIDALKQKYTGEQLKEQLIDLGIREANRYGWNDTYTFTKWMGEQILLKRLQGKSLTILRPSIVESTLTEPAAGWIEGVKVADAIIMAYARGKVSLFPGRPEGVLDIIPADLVANSIILGLAELFYVPRRHKIYHCCSGGSNPVTLKAFRDHVQAEAQENWHKYDRLFYERCTKPFVFVNKHLFASGMKMLKSLLTMKYRLQGRSLDYGEKPKELQNIETAINLSTVFSFYTAANYVFQNQSLRDLASRMNEKSTFPVDARAIDWAIYVRAIHIPGLNRYALHDRKIYSLKAKKQAMKASKAA